MGDSVGVGVLVGVGVNVGVGVCVGVGVGVNIGPNNWPGPHADTTKPIASTVTIAILRIVFINFLRYHGRTRRLLK